MAIIAGHMGIALETNTSNLFEGDNINEYPVSTFGRFSSFFCTFACLILACSQISHVPIFLLIQSSCILQLVLVSAHW